MRRLLILGLFIHGLALAPAATAQSGGGFDQDWHSVDGGGTVVTGGGFSLAGSVGQHDAAAASIGGGFAHDGGLWRGVCGGTLFSYGSGCAGTGGFVPTLAMTGCAASGYDVVLDIANGPGPSQAIVLLGLGQASTPIGGGCALNVSPVLPVTVGPLPLFGVGPGNGAISAPVTIPPVAAVLITVTLQAVIGDATAPNGLGFTLTNGVSVTLG